MSLPEDRPLVGPRRPEALDRPRDPIVPVRLALDHGCDAPGLDDDGEVYRLLTPVLHRS